MHRRRYLAGLTAGIAGLAGCSGAGDTTGDNTTVVGTAPDSFSDVELPVPRQDLVRGASKDGIPAITDPAFGEDWVDIEVAGFGSGAGERKLADDDRVVGIERDGAARAYPLRVLDIHEIVNDAFAGPLLVTYCPLCGSGVTAIREVDGSETTFGVSGLLWQSDLVMYDRATESYWSQILATAIRGPRTGETLQLVPSTLTTWGEWQSNRPDTEVLLPPPHSETITDNGTRNYAITPYSGYEDSRQIGIGRNEFDDDRLHPKTRVIGITHDGTARAYPKPELPDDSAVTDDVNGLPVVVAKTPDGALVAYVRRVGGQPFEVTDDGPDYFEGAGTRWNVVTGEGVSGRHEGATLERANDRSQMFWFAWLDFHPETDLYRG